ncbi:hypothetical protein LEP1GSC016_3079 [Leptospira borgpetersenii serovar Hardjo-bovis str. Sponselee]|uniref:Uncharacterized protein n=1 Tax=Leptospira borgpetersenii serovar Hardjo-bovis str. Sponselee TaxID=1303729 RepID=M6BVR5_LEPBO|nr:hypothetical protein LEP1GSC016_3079 [Leptospira borgpetersenii serovar Hardjo-bovis str. Sponselee]
MGNLKEGAVNQFQFELGSVWRILRKFSNFSPKPGTPFRSIS